MTKKEINKSIEYPIIYSYIYERESEDIKRLARKFATTKKTPHEKTGATSAIRGFRIENGEAIPIYSEAKVLATSDTSKAKNAINAIDKIGAKKVVAIRKNSTNKGKKN